jgi:hypothetical protein
MKARIVVQQMIDSHNPRKLVRPVLSSAKKLPVSTVSRDK